MPVVQCPNPECGRRYSVADDGLGRKVSCRGCGRPFTASVSTEPPREAVAAATHGVDHPQPPAEAAPRRLGRFEIRARLGSGAFGSVYRAWDPQLEREVALKVPHEHALQSEAARERFLREPKAAAQLRHPHIVPVFDAGRGGGRAYIASAYVEGRTLADAADARRLPPAEAAAVVRKLAEALDYAHSLGIIHRDVKPANVMLDGRGEPHLMDFGLARLEGTLERVTHDGAVLGTPAYMSPEQARGDQQQIGPASDQYSLGVVLYELLAGQTPFSGPAAVVIVNTLNRPVPPPRSLDPRIPRDLETVCLKALAKEPGARYASCGDLAEDLRRWAAGAPVRARPLGPAARAARWCRRNPLAAGLAAALAGALLAGTAVAWSLALRADRRAGEATAARDEARRERDRADAQTREARQAGAREAAERARMERALYFTRVTLADAEWRASDVARAESLLDSCPAHLRGWEWAYLKRRCHLEELALEQGAPVCGLTYLPGGHEIVSAGRDRTLRFWDASTGEQRRSLAAGDVFSLGVSADGRRLATGGNAPTVVRDTATGQELRILPQPTRGTGIGVALDRGGALVTAARGPATVWDVATGEVKFSDSLVANCVALSPGGEWLAAADANSAVVAVWDLRSKARTGTLAGSAGHVNCLAFNAGGTRLAAGATGAVEVWDVAGGSRLQTLHGHAGPIMDVEFGPEGTQLASCGVDRTVRVWDLASSREVRLLRGHGDSALQVAFSPDGRRLASAGTDGAIKVWDPWSEGAAEGVRSVGLGEPGYALAFSADGTRVAIAGGQAVSVREVVTGREMAKLRRPYPRDASEFRSLAFSPDGTAVAVPTADFCVLAWSLSAPQQPRKLSGHGGVIGSLVFSPDGRRLASASDDGTVRVWDVQTGTESLVLRGSAGPAGALAFSPDGVRLTTTGADGLAVWEAGSGDRVGLLPGQPTATVFSRDGSRFAAMSPDGKRLLIRDAATGAEIAALDGPAGMSGSVAFSPDGTRIATGTAAHVVRLWDAEGGEEALTLRGHAGVVTSVAFSPDGTRLASAAQDRTLRFWELGDPAGALQPTADGRRRPAPE